MSKRLLIVLLLSTLCAVAGAQERTSLRTLGRGIAIVFSPDLSVQTNCVFYERLGFACYQTPSWHAVLEDISCRNASSPDRAIKLVILETHGTNGNGLKLQTSSDAAAFRSYAAVGALQEKLGVAGVRYCIISACNSRRLFRPSIYNTLDPRSDPLFLPATLGIINARDELQTQQTSLHFLARADSHVESLSLAKSTDLSKPTTHALGLSNEAPIQFVVSDLLVQLLTNDPLLDLRIAMPVEKLQRSTPEDMVADMLFARFVEYLDRLATLRQDAMPLIAVFD